jgi:glycosyltransferase involved in cell wall biosynthesis
LIINKPIDLCVVVPVYNESSVLNQFASDWIEELRKLKISFIIHFLDDGSTDSSWQVLEEISVTYPEARICRHKNIGHGPTILKGYHSSLDSRWILQLDSDHEIEPKIFFNFWENRFEYDMVIGKRQRERNISLFRKILSKVSTFLVQYLFGGVIEDANCPFRLMNSKCVKNYLRYIPNNCFAPNLLLTSQFVYFKKNILTINSNVTVEKRKIRKGFSLRMMLGGFLSICCLIKLKINLLLNSSK